MAGVMGGTVATTWRRGVAAAMLIGVLAVGAGCGAGAGGGGSEARTAGAPSSTSGSRGTDPQRSPAAGGRLVDDARWVTREGESALQVTPSRQLRDATDAAVFDDAWGRIVRAIPRADTPGMRDQFVCHATFAPFKAAWYLEPRRPAVGYWQTVLAGCNPGDVRDVG